MKNEINNIKVLNTKEIKYNNFQEDIKLRLSDNIDNTDDDNYNRKLLMQKNSKIIKQEETPKHNFSDENDEFKDLFNNDNISNKSIEIEAERDKSVPKKNINKINIDETINNNINNNFYDTNTNNIDLKFNNLDQKPKNSMTIKLNFDSNTVELNSKFVEINTENQIHVSNDEEAEGSYCEDYDEVENEENYEDDNYDNQLENMEIDENNENNNDGYCMVREKSTIITIPNLNFLSERNFEIDKIKNENLNLSNDSKHIKEKENINIIDRSCNKGFINESSKDYNISGSGKILIIYAVESAFKLILKIYFV